MTVPPQLRTFGVSVAKFIKRYHITLYTLTIVIAVSVAVFMINQIFLSASPSEQPGPTETRFDQHTITRIEQFNPASSAADTFSLPAGRTNPFSE